MLDSFRFEDENDQEYEIWLQTFLHILKNRHPGKLHCTFDSPEKLAMLSWLEEVKGWEDLVAFAVFDTWIPSKDCTIATSPILRKTLIAEGTKKKGEADINNHGQKS